MQRSRPPILAATSQLTNLTVPLRHSYVTHLVEFDYPERFIQEQVGHSFSSTTAVYVGVSNEYRNRLISQSMQSRYGHHFTRGPQ